MRSSPTRHFPILANSGHHLSRLVRKGVHMQQGSPLQHCIMPTTIWWSRLCRGCLKKAKPLFVCLLVWFGSLIWESIPWKWLRWNMVDIAYHEEACSRPDGRASQEGESTGDSVTCTSARGTRLQPNKWSHIWTWIDIIRHILLCVQLLRYILFTSSWLVSKNLLSIKSTDKNKMVGNDINRHLRLCCL